MDYTKLNKSLRICAGPGCGDECPYYGETKGGKTCRAWLLSDAETAIAAEEAKNAALREECEKLAADRDELKEYALALEKEGQEARAELDAERLANSDLEGKVNDLDAAARTIREERDILRERCQVQQNEINALLLRVGKVEDETDRPSVISDDLAKQIGELVAHANYQQGRADTLAEIVERCSFGGGGRHE